MERWKEGEKETVRKEGKSVSPKGELSDRRVGGQPPPDYDVVRRTPPRRIMNNPRPVHPLTSCVYCPRPIKHSVFSPRRLGAPAFVGVHGMCTGRGGRAGVRIVSDLDLDAPIPYTVFSSRRPGWICTVRGARSKCVHSCRETKR